MRILYLSQYFPPEVGATQTRAYEMARNWVQMGHKVTMLAEIPNHPAGVIPATYRGKLYERSDLDGIDVIRVWVKTSPHKNFRNRMLFYLTFMVNAFLAGLLLARSRYDLIYATSPPLFVGGAALALSSLRRIPLVFEVRDLWPESAVAMGELTSPWAIQLATRLEEACYRRAKRIVVVTQSIYRALKDRGIPEEELCLVTNGANTDLFQYRPAEREALRNELGLTDKFLVIYAGIHGLAQGLEIVIEAARLLADHADIHFLFIGDGPKKKELEVLAAALKLPNLTLLTEKPRELIPGYLSAADVSLIPLRRLDLFKGALPSKIFDAWACERPLLLSVEGEARHLMEMVAGGWFVPPEDPLALVEAVIRMKALPGEREDMGKRGRRYTETLYSRQALAQKLMEELEKAFR